MDLRLLSPSPSDAQTTVMLRNIPNRYSQAQLLHEIEEAGFEGEYDFFYLPMDTHNKTNVGYAFINFTHPDSMQRFIQTFFGYRFKDHSSHKIAKVSTAHLQGFWSNVQHFSNRAVTHARNSQYRPIVVIDGQRMDMSEVVSRLLAEEYASWWQSYEGMDCPATSPETSDPFPPAGPGSVAAAAVAEGADVAPSAVWGSAPAWGLAVVDNVAAYDCAAPYGCADACNWGLASPDYSWFGGEDTWPQAPWHEDGPPLMCGPPFDVVAVGRHFGGTEGHVEGGIVFQSGDGIADSSAAADGEFAFSVDRSGFEKVMSRWLEGVSHDEDADKLEPEEEDASSTAGDTRALSSSASHRSLSPLVQKQMSTTDGYGVWGLPSVLDPSYCNIETPRAEHLLSR